ncbi:MAG: hypothetical protein WC876_04095 [Candidatus Thermoplasmatota archaeon]|jgi:hypothetical protein
MKLRPLFLVVAGAILLAVVLAVTWIFARPLFVWMLILAPVAIIVVGLVLQALAILSREEPLK